MDAVFSIAQIHRARPERIGLAPSHEPGQVRLARDHLLWRDPVRPFFHAADALAARPSEAFAADADAVTNRPSLPKDQVEVSVRRVDDDGAGLAQQSGNRRPYGETGAVSLWSTPARVDSPAAKPRPLCRDPGARQEEGLKALI